MLRPQIPVLTLVLVPILALGTRTREPMGELVCPPDAYVARAGRPATAVTFTGAQEGAAWADGVALRSEEYLQLPLPRHQGWVQMEIRADHDDEYVLEVPSPRGWSRVGEFGRAEPPGLRNRPVVEVAVGDANMIAMSLRRGGQHASVSMVCVRGTRWTIPAWLSAAFLLGSLFVLLRSVPHRYARRLVRAWARADPLVALLFGLVVLTTPLLLVAIGPAMLGLRAWRGRGAARERRA